MSKELSNLYRHLELPLMVLLDNMRHTGIGVDGETCAREVKQIEREMAVLAQEITGGEDIDLRSDLEVFRFLAKQGVQFQDPPCTAKGCAQCYGKRAPVPETTHGAN